MMKLSNRHGSSNKIQEKNVCCVIKMGIPLTNFIYVARLSSVMSDAWILNKVSIKKIILIFVDITFIVLASEVTCYAFWDTSTDFLTLSRVRHIYGWSICIRHQTNDFFNTVQTHCKELVSIITYRILRKLVQSTSKGFSMRVFCGLSGACNSPGVRESGVQSKSNVFSEH